MARIRTVKPELFRHEELYELEQETGLPVRLAFIGLFTACDREGRFKWRPLALKLDALPFDNVDFSRVLDALESRGFVVRYRIGTEDYGCIPTFCTHQAINNRESASVLPSQDDARAIIHDNQVVTKCESHVNDASSTRAIHEEHAPSGEGKGREGKGKEGEKTCQDSAPLIPPLDGKTPDRFIFDFWVETMGKRGDTQLTEKRKRCILARLKEGYDVEFIKRAIVGCSKSPHHMGQNDAGTVYDDLTLICRSGDKLEFFANNVAKKPIRLDREGPETLEEFEERVRQTAGRVGDLLGDMGGDGDDQV